MPVYNVFSGEQVDWGYNSYEPPEYYKEWCVVTAENKKQARTNGVKAFRKMKCDFLSNGENPFKGLTVELALEYPESGDKNDPFEYTPPFTVLDLIEEAKAQGVFYDFTGEFVS